MSTTWQCGVCETINHSNRECTACGPTSRVASFHGRNRLPPVLPPPPPSAPLPDPSEAIKREPVPETEWEDVEEEIGYHVTPIPGGCLVSLGPRLRR